MAHVSASAFTLLSRLSRNLALIFSLAAVVAAPAAAQDDVPETDPTAYAPLDQVSALNVAAPSASTTAPAPAPISAPTPVPTPASTPESSPAISETAPVIAFQQPAFPGGPAELARFLSQNLQYPSAAADAHVSGRVVVSFWVDETGRAYGFGAVQSPHLALAAEALRVARKITHWVPGVQNGRPASMEMYLPVVFKLMPQ